MNKQKQVQVGLGIIIIRDNKILLGKRKNAHGAGEWSLPGGHQEYNEDWEETARRELKEETDMDLKQAKFVSATNDRFPKEDKHYVTIFLQGIAYGEPKLMEPDKCEKWEWFDLDALPQPLFTPLNNLLATRLRLETVKN